MKRTSNFYRIFIFAATFACLLTNAAFAQSFSVSKGELSHFKDKVTGKVLPNTEPSGVETIGSGKYLLIADDNDGGNGRGLRIVESASGKIETVLTNFQGGDKNPKWESLAKIGENCFFTAGSHNDPDETKRLRRSRIFRVCLNTDKETDPQKFDITSFREFDIKDSLKSSGLELTAKLEGLALRKKGGKTELVFGLREPFEEGKKGAEVVRKTQVYAAELPDDFDKPGGKVKLSLKKLFEFEAGFPKDSTIPFKLSSLEYVEGLKGFLVLTSTEDGNNKFFGNALWFVADEAIQKAAPADAKAKFAAAAAKILEFEPSMKAEGVCVTGNDGKGNIGLLIVYDNDELLPGMLQRLTLTVKP
ncbi:MAG: hypothetical protein LUM44_14080 [Pyrinomonadaceae bacterium]|nr:hypothetical protein [Pyrinomonadaceae bacterium]